MNDLFNAADHTFKAMLKAIGVVLLLLLLGLLTVLIRPNSPPQLPPGWSAEEAAEAIQHPNEPHLKHEIPQATSNTVVNLFATMLVLKGKCHAEFSPATFNALELMATAAGVDLHSPQTQAQIKLEAFRLLETVRAFPDDATFCKVTAEQWRE